MSKKTRPFLSVLLAIAWLTLASGCARPPVTQVTLLKATSLSEAQGRLLNQKADLEQFRLRGPFSVNVQKDYQVRLSAKERIKADLFLSAHAEKAPLVVILHGHESSKEAHTYQAMHLASWGMHCLALQLPNVGRWVSNGKTLVRIVNFIYRRPETIDSRIDVNKIILVGHSLGGTSVAIALAEGAPSAGGILLDPAGIGKALPQYLRRIKAPMLVLGADERVFAARYRNHFFRYIRSSVAEVSIKDATHEDAQYPSETALQMFGIDPFTTEELQVTFVSALTSAAFSLSATGKFDYAWTSFGELIENGKFIGAKKK